MSDNVYVNRDRSQVVPKGSADAKWQISRKEAKALGLVDSDEKPRQARRTTTTTTQRRRKPKSE